MKKLIITNLIDKKLIAEASITSDDQLDIAVKVPELKAEIETMLQNLFQSSKSYRTGQSAADEMQTYKTLKKKARGEQRLYAIWDNIAGGNFKIGGQSVRAYVDD